MYLLIYGRYFRYRQPQKRQHFLKFKKKTDKKKWKKKQLKYFSFPFCPSILSNVMFSHTYLTQLPKSRYKLTDSKERKKKKEVKVSGKVISCRVSKNK